MTVYQCHGCPSGYCTLFILDDDCCDPIRGPWSENGNEPVWRLMEVKE